MRRIGVIGSGEIALIHFEALRRQGASFTSAFDVNKETLQAFCRETGASPCACAEEMIADESLDTLFICTRHDSHVSLAYDALRAGKTVFLEKPLALSAREALPLFSLPKEQQERLYIGYNMRHTPAMLHLKQVMKERQVQVESFRANMTGAPFMSGWASDPRLGGGVLVCQGSHMFDLITSTLGSPIASVMADTRHVRLCEDRMPDMAALLLRLKNGVTGTLLLHDQGCYAFHVDPGAAMVNLTLYSREGTYDTDAYGTSCFADVKTFSNFPSADPADRVRAWGYEQQMDLFLNAPDQLCTLAQAIYVASCVDAAARSAQSGQWEDVIEPVPFVDR